MCGKFSNLTSDYECVCVKSQDYKGNVAETNLDDDMHIKLLCVQTNAFIESGSLGVIKVHGNIHLNVHQRKSIKNDLAIKINKEIDL